MPVFEEASAINMESAPGKLVWASVDSDRQGEIAQKYHVSKYPTLKLFRNGELVKKEYRGQRSVSALSDFIRKQVSPATSMFESKQILEQQIDRNRRNMVAYFDKSFGPEFDNYNKLASSFQDDCVFWFGSGGDFVNETINGPKLEFWSSKNDEKIEYVGGLSNFASLREWANEHCVPLVREITFENAEDLTEEGLPFLLYFGHPDNTEGQKIFADQVARELNDQISSINCLYADGRRFSHPLHHLGKTEDDLPVVAIDSFRHMYLFPDIKELTVPGKLRQFVLDLHSGKLHREFHHGPDTTQVTEEQTDAQANGEKTLPPTSIFKQLKPSEMRYSLLRKDEL